MFLKLFRILLGLVLVTSARASDPALDAATPTPPPSAAIKETPAQYEARVHWLREARFGMFIHWGVYAVTSGEWKGKYYTSGGEWIERIGKISIADYKALGKDFTASKYDPNAWADMARDAGMKYVVITAKHHDGFALYDSQVSDWNSVKASAAKRDLLAPLAEAVRADGLKFCLYYSQSQDWTNPGGGNYGDDPKWDPAQNGDYDKYLQKIALPQVREILTRFHPAVLWWDTPVSMTPARAKPFADLLRETPDILSNSRLGGGYGGDTGNAEQGVPSRFSGGGKLLEVCMTINGTWGYKEKDQDWKSTRQLLHVLTDTASKGGNLLLNVGPTAEGEFPPATVDRLQAIGRWMKVNGEAIYATDAGPFPRPLPWGRTTQKQTADGSTTLYLHVWNWPEDGKLLLAPLQEKPVSGRLLATGAPVSAVSTPAGLVVTLPGHAPDADVSVVALQFASPLTVTQKNFNVPGADGRIEIGALDSYQGGTLNGAITVANAGPDAYLTGWTDAGWYVEYEVKTPTAGKWKVSAEIAAEVPANLTLNVRDAKVPVPVEITPTGGKQAWKTVDLGTLDLHAGETTIQLKPGKQWKAGPELRRFWLTPVKNETATP